MKPPTRRPEPKSNRRRQPSSPAAATSLPSGDSAIAFTPPPSVDRESAGPPPAMETIERSCVVSRSSPAEDPYGLKKGNGLGFCSGFVVKGLRRCLGT